MIRERVARFCAVVCRAVHRVSVARSSSLTTNSAFGRPVITPPGSVESPLCYIESLRQDTSSDDQVAPRYEVRCEIRKAILAPVCVAHLQLERLTFHVASIGEAGT